MSRSKSVQVNALFSACLPPSGNIQSRTVRWDQAIETTGYWTAADDGAFGGPCGIRTHDLRIKRHSVDARDRGSGMPLASPCIIPPVPRERETLIRT